MSEEILDRIANTLFNLSDTSTSDKIDIKMFIYKILNVMTPEETLFLLANKFASEKRMLALVEIKPQTGGDEDAFIITDRDNFAHAVILPQTAIITYGVEK